MINVNLLPGSGKKTKARGSSIGTGQLLAGVLAQVKDPFLLGAVAGVVVAALAVGGMFMHHQAASVAVDAELQAAEQDSIKYSAMIREKMRTQAQRDSVLTELTLIRSIDGRRFVWSHIMDEVSRALPPYTWLTSIQQTSAPGLPTQSMEKSDTAKKARPAAKGSAGAQDTTARAALKFRIVGNTVDIQALTRFMKDLEASPFVQAVTLNKTALIPSDGKEVTQFELDCEYQTPDPAAIQTVAVSTEAR